jgi:hypothetical protein
MVEKMRFKIQGEKEEIDEKQMTTVVEILGKKAIEKLIEDKIMNSLGSVEKDIADLRNRVYALEEQASMKRRELIKLEEYNDKENKNKD